MNGSEPAAAANALGPEAEVLAAVDPLALGGATARLAAGLALNPLGVLQATGRYVSGMIAATSAATARALGGNAPGPVAPAPRDRRFADATWSENPEYFWLEQSYLLFGRLVQELVSAGAGSGPTATKLRLAAEIATDALAPTNFLPGAAPRSSAAPATSSPTSRRTAACRVRSIVRRSPSARTWRRRLARSCSATS